MPTIFTDEVTAAMSSKGCPLCRVTADDDRRWLEIFRREARRDADLRHGFFAAGGFCRRHAWALHDSAEAALAVADVYGALADRDLASLDGFDRRRRRSLRRTGRCPACVAGEEALERKVFFFLQALATETVGQRYVTSDGLCFAHLAAVIEQAGGDDERTIAFLVEDWRGRLAAVRARLADFDRKRDHRYAHERRGDEQDSVTAVVGRYVGEDELE
jgi:hypothetical protein